MLRVNNSGALTGSTIKNGKKMKVKLLRPISINGVRVDAEEVVELNQLLSLELINTNKAVKVEEEPKEEAEEVKAEIVEKPKKAKRSKK